MRYFVIPIFAAVLLILTVQVLAADEPTAMQIMESRDRQFQADDETSQINMNIINKRGKETKRKMTQWNKEVDSTEEKRFVEFTAPGDIKGTLLLTYDYSEKDDDIWLFLPALGRPRRISAGNKTDSFVGTNLTFYDLENVSLANINFKLIKTEEYGGESCYVIEGLPANKKEEKSGGYTKRIWWVSQKYFLDRKVEHYDKKGKLVKVLKLDDIQEIPGTEKARAFRLEMENVQKGSKTILEYTTVELNKGVPDSKFSQRNLK